MAQKVGRIELDLGLNYKAFNKELGGIGPKATSLISGAFGKLGTVAAVAFSTKALYQFGKGAIGVASDLVEVQNVVDVTFGKMAEHVNQFSKTALEQFGMSELSAKKYASTMGAMLKSSGFGVKAATTMSIEMSKLTADMASFYNLETDAMFQKILSGLSGETMPLKQLGINMNVANLEAYALSQGIKKAYNEMSQAEQTMLRYNYLLKASADSQGDFARNSGTWANQVKILTEKWREFSSLIGKALMEILLPTVKFLNKCLDVLIAITKEIGKIYTMISGKEVVVEANNSISDSAEDAVDSEYDLADGIKKSSKEAKKALAPFDELNILRRNLGKGGSGPGLGSLDTIFTTNKVDDGLMDFKLKEEEGEKFYLWWDNFLTKLRNAALVPIPAPVFENLPHPIYDPEWGLTPPLVPLPAFPAISPLPIYDLGLGDWGLNPPKVPMPVFPSLVPMPLYSLGLNEWGLNPPTVPLPIFPSLSPIPIYDLNLETWGLNPPEIPIPLIPAIDWSAYKQSMETWKTWAKTQLDGMGKDVTTFLGEVVKALNTHKTNVGTITSAIMSVAVANVKAGLNSLATGVENVLNSIQNGLNVFGSNVAAISFGIGAALVGNFSNSFQSLVGGFNSLFSGVGKGVVSWGTGLLKSFGQVAAGIANSMIDGLKSAWNAFMDFARATGEKVSGFFSANREVVIKTAVIGAVGGAAIMGTAMLAPAAVPYVMKGIQAIGMAKAAGAFAKGGVVDQPTLALIGEAGKEVVMPLENNTGWIDGLAHKIASVMAISSMGSQGSSQPMKLIVNIGEDTLVEYLIDALNREFMVRGETTLNI